jgi:hypothetical protein
MAEIFIGVGFQSPQKPALNEEYFLLFVRSFGLDAKVAKKVNPEISGAVCAA